MDVIDPATSAYRNAARLFHVVTEHPEHLVTELVLLEIGTTIFGAKDQMQPDTGKGLRHGEVS
jgi:hypothetical protein